MQVAGAQLGGAPLILSHHRLQLPPSSAAATLAGAPPQVTAAGLLNGSLAHQTQPPPLIAPGDTMLYQYAASISAADYAAANAASYTGLVSPLLAAEYSTDPSGGLFAR